MACAHTSSYAHAPGPLCYLCRIGLQVESHVRTKTSRPVSRECQRNTLLYAWKLHENVCDQILAVLAVSCHKCSHSHQHHFTPGHAPPSSPPPSLSMQRRDAETRQNVCQGRLQAGFLLHQAWPSIGSHRRHNRLYCSPQV